MQWKEASKQASTAEEWTLRECRHGTNGSKDLLASAACRDAPKQIEAPVMRAADLQDHER
jgi:hypothetical protein